MKKNSIIIILFLVLLNSCSSKRNFKLSEFKFQGKEHNELIQDRYPFYDIDSPYGDVRMGQISLSIDKYDKDTLSGTVTDSETDDGLLFPKVELYFQNERDSITIIADSLGKFKTNIPSRLKKLKVSYIGYEPLIIDLLSLK